MIFSLRRAQQEKRKRPGEGLSPPADTQLCAIGSDCVAARSRRPLQATTARERAGTLSVVSYGRSRARLRGRGAAKRRSGVPEIPFAGLPPISALSRRERRQRPLAPASGARGNPLLRRKCTCTLRKPRATSAHLCRRGVCCSLSAFSSLSALLALPRSEGCASR